MNSIEKIVYVYGSVIKTVEVDNIATGFIQRNELDECYSVFNLDGIKKMDVFNVLEVHYDISTKER